MKDNETDIVKWISLVEEEINVKSDRALIITIAAILDMQLENLLKNFMIADSKRDEKLFNNNSPMSNFSAKISVCYYLGLISKYDYNILEKIRKIRNIFAHEIEIKKMDDSQAIKDLCNNLNIPKDMYIPDNFIFSQKDCIEHFDNESLTNKIIKVFKNLTVYLEYRKVDIYESKRTMYENISYVQLLENCLLKVRKNAMQIYKLNEIYKQNLIEKLENIDTNNKERTEIINKIKNIDEVLNAYSKGNISHGLDMNEEETKKALDEISYCIKKLKNNTNEESN